MGAKFSCHAELRAVTQRSLIDQVTDGVPSCYLLTCSLHLPSKRSSLPALLDIPQDPAVATPGLANLASRDYGSGRAGTILFSPLGSAAKAGDPEACRGSQASLPSSPCLPKAVLGHWGTPSLTLASAIVSLFMLFLPAECMPVSLPCQHFHSTQRAVNYESCFSPVNSSQSGMSPSFSFVNEAKTQLFTQLCLEGRQLIPCPSPHPQKPQLCLSLDPALKRVENRLLRDSWE